MVVHKRQYKSEQNSSSIQETPPTKEESKNTNTEEMMYSESLRVRD